MEDKDFMNGDFEADFFSPLSEEEPVVKQKKEKKPVNKKLLFGIIGAVAALTVATILFFVISAALKTPKDRFIEGMEALKAELENPGPTWQEAVGYEDIMASWYTDAMYADMELNLTLPEQLTVGFDILHESDYPNEVSNTDVAVSVYNIPLVETDITLDKDMWYIAFPEIMEEIYAINGATLGRDYNACEWAEEYLGLLVAENYVWEGFTGPTTSFGEVNTEFDAMISKDIDRIKENMVVEEEDEPDMDGVSAAKEYLCVVLQKEDINALFEDLMDFYEESGLADTQEMYFPELAEDIELLAALDKKGRIVAISGQDPITFTEETMGEWEYGFLFSGKENVTDRMIMTFDINLEGESATAIVEYEKTEKDGAYGNEISVLMTADDDVEAFVMEIGYDREWDPKEKKFKDFMEMSMEGETISIEIKGGFKDIVAGKQFTLDLSKFALDIEGEELFKLTGEMTLAPFEGEIKVPEESVNIFSLSETEMEGLLTEIIDSIYAKVLGE